MRNELKGACLAYVSGPIDAARTYRDWVAKAAPDYFGTIYLNHLFALIEQMGSDALIITTLPKGQTREKIDRITVVNLPMPEAKKGLGYHVGMVTWALRSALEILKFRADIALLTAGQDYFWVFRPLRILGIRLIASLHCTLWPKYAPQAAHKKFLYWLNGRFFYPVCAHIQGVSQEAVEQILSTSPRLKKKPARFIATYDPGRFARVKAPNWPKPPAPFRLLYVGRLEVNKGVLDLVQIMQRLEQDEPGRYRLEICGEGSAEGQLRQAVTDLKLDRIITVNGQCATSELAEKYTECHAVVVPTRSDFEEGTPKVAFEAVLNLRPVVMSAACPALADVAEAAVEPRVDDVDDYVRAIRSLSQDPAFYAAKVNAADPARQKHFDERNSYGSVLGAGLRSIVRSSRACSVVQAT